MNSNAVEWLVDDARNHLSMRITKLEEIVRRDDAKFAVERDDAYSELLQNGVLLRSLAWSKIKRQQASNDRSMLGATRGWQQRMIARFKNNEGTLVDIPYPDVLGISADGAAGQLMIDKMVLELKHSIQRAYENGELHIRLSVKLYNFAGKIRGNKEKLQKMTVFCNKLMHGGNKVFISLNDSVFYDA